jgi:hypothetical protein
VLTTRARRSVQPSSLRYARLSSAHYGATTQVPTLLHKVSDAPTDPFATAQEIVEGESSWLRRRDFLGQAVGFIKVSIFARYFDARDGS